MNQERVRITALTNRERLASANRNDVNIDAARGLKKRKDVVEETGVLGRSRGTQGDKAALSLRVATEYGHKKKREGADHRACLHALN
jgi:hypothetical protein